MFNHVNHLGDIDLKSREIDGTRFIRHHLEILSHQSLQSHLIKIKNFLLNGVNELVKRKQIKFVNLQLLVE